MSYSLIRRRPTNLSIVDELPSHIRRAAGIRQDETVVAWTTIDPNHADDICQYLVCRTTMKPMLYCPCILCPLFCCNPWLWSYVHKLRIEVQSSFWILTERQLKVLRMQHDPLACCCCCCLRLFQNGYEVKTIDLKNIIDCWYDERAEGIIGDCTASLPRVYVDVKEPSYVKGKGGTYARQHGAVGVALGRHEWFCEQVLHYRDQLLNSNMTTPPVVPTAIDDATACPQQQQQPHHQEDIIRIAPSNVVAPQQPPNGSPDVMERGSATSTVERSAASRIQEITELYQCGLVTQEQYERKKRSILDSI